MHNSGYTPLHLEGGADLDARHENGQSPLHWAAWRNNNPSVVAALLDSGADPTSRKQFGELPVDLSAQNPKLHGTEFYILLAAQRRSILSPIGHASGRDTRGSIHGDAVPHHEALMVVGMPGMCTMNEPALSNRLADLRAQSGWLCRVSCGPFVRIGARGCD